MVRHRPSRLICRIDVSGFLAIMLFFYFLFAIPAGMSHPDGVSVDMPKAGHSVSLPGAGREDALIITVFRDGKVFFGPEPVSLDELASKLRQRNQGPRPRTAYIQADLRCRYVAVKGVLESIHAAGIESVAFLTSPRGRSGLM